MTAWIVPPVAGLIEPALAPEIVADAIGAIELNRGMIRIYLYAEQMPLDSGAKHPSRVVTAKIVAPLSALPDAIARLAAALTAEHAPAAAPDPEPGPFPRIVR